MKLVTITGKELNKLGEKGIYCFVKNESYLKEINEKKCAVFSKIECVIEENTRYHQDIIFESKTIKVTSFDKCKGIDWNEKNLLITSDYYMDAFDYIRNLIWEETFPHVVYAFINYENELELEQRALLEMFPLKNLLLFRSGPHKTQYVPGMDFADNSRALFEYMIREGLNEKYEMIWMVKNPAEYGKYASITNVSFISWDWNISEDMEKRDAYYRALFLSKYIFFTDAYGFAKNCRPDQIRVQLWHGCGFKTRTNFVRCEHRYEYNIVVGNKYKQIHKDIYGLRDDQVIITGYPKEDLLFYPIKKEELLKLGIPKANKYIIWMPTFRSAWSQLSELNEVFLKNETGLPIVETKYQLSEINDMLKKSNTTLVIKLHPFQKRELIDIGNYEDIVLLENELLVKNDIQINNVLGWADALISDYSSTVIDYLVLNRPIAMTMDDVEIYEKGRGFVFENIHDWVPGTEIYSFAEFKDFINSVIVGNDYTACKRADVRSRVHAFADNQSCRRVLEAFRIE